MTETDPEPRIPTRDEIDALLLRVEQLRQHAETHKVWAWDLMDVVARLTRERALGRLVEGGCASRILRVAEGIRNVGGEHASAVDLARDIIQHECLPSPGWSVLLAEFEAFRGVSGGR